MAGGQVNRPTAPASPAPCPFMDALRTGWQGPEVPKVSGGGGGRDLRKVTQEGVAPLA